MNKNNALLTQCMESVQECIFHPGLILPYEICNAPILQFKPILPGYVALYICASVGKVLGSQRVNSPIQWSIAVRGLIINLLNAKVTIFAKNMGNITHLICSTVVIAFLQSCTIEKRILRTRIFLESTGSMSIIKTLKVKKILSVQQTRKNWDYLGSIKDIYTRLQAKGSIMGLKRLHNESDEFGGLTKI